MEYVSYIVVCAECGKQMRDHVTNFVRCKEGQRPSEAPKADRDRCTASADGRHKPKWERA